MDAQSDALAGGPDVRQGMFETAGNKDVGHVTLREHQQHIAGPQGLECLVNLLTGQLDGGRQGGFCQDHNAVAQGARHLEQQVGAVFP